MGTGSDQGRRSVVPPRSRPWILLVVSTLAVGVYLLVSWSSYRVGFPLDDAWIHQTYARNLALRGEWAFSPGQPSAGSTAPLWSTLLAVGHALGLGPYLWTYLLGVLTLWGLAWTGMALFGRLSPVCRRFELAAGIFLALEWHLVWAAASGMETILQALLVLVVFFQLLSDRQHWFAIGAVIGLSVWVRPDGITLLGPALLVLVLLREPQRERLRSGFYLALGFTTLFVPYLIFNQMLAGSWWPNTFFAKQAEYAAELNSSLFSRLWEQASLPVVGAGLLLLPGFFYFLLVSIQKKSWVLLAGVLWFTGNIALYALRLPVTYQHGRYLMPAMPVYFLWGFAGVVILLTKPLVRTAQRIVGRVWLLSIVLVWSLFFLMGANAYTRDVAIIESEMVATSLWIAKETPISSLVAAHDIGAIGYFGGRRLLDLAGLVSPEVIPFIRDQARLAVYLDEEGADYLVTFPGWYPELVGELHPVYQSNGSVAPQAGGENIVVYRWP